MKTTIHRVPFGKFATFLGYSCMAIGLTFLIRLLFQLVLGSNIDNVSVMDVISVVLPTFVGCAVVNLYPNIEVCKQGLRVQVFGFHWMFVPWSDLIAMDEIRSPYSSGPSRGMVVQAHGLTPIHQLMVASITKETTRGFIISNSISGYDQLVETIRQKLNEGAA